MFESLDLPLPLFFSLRDGKIEQIERFAAFFVYFFLLVVDVVDGVSERFFLLLSRGWSAGSSRKTL